MKNMLHLVAASILLIFSGATALAQADAQARSQVAASAPPQTPSSPTSAVAPAPGPLPVVDAAKELKGTALVEALRKGGFVLYMRHTEGGSLEEKCDETSVSAVGAENARIVGSALRELSIPIGAVRSSAPCRSNVTASTLGLGTVDITEDLNPVAPRDGFDIGAARTKRLNEMPTAGTNTVLVSHLHGSRKKEEWVHLQLGEIIVFRPDANANAEPVARIPVAGWAALKKAMADAAVR